MFELVKSATFDTWFGSLRDVCARARIAARIDYGPGYRVYFMQRGAVLVVVLAGGDKRTQRIDIKTAQRIAAEWERGS